MRAELYFRVASIVLVPACIPNDPDPPSGVGYVGVSTSIHKDILCLIDFNFPNLGLRRTGRIGWHKPPRLRRLPRFAYIENPQSGVEVGQID